MDRFFGGVLRALAWGLSVLMFLGALSGFFSGQIVTGLCYTVVCLSSAPPLWDAIKTRGWTVPTWSRWVAGLAFITLAVVTTRPTSPGTTVAEAEASASAEAARVAMPVAEKNAQARTLVLKIKEAGAECDGYGRNLADGQTQKMAKIQRQFAEGEVACRAAAEAIRKIDVPDYGSAAHRTTVEDALKEMAGAYASKSDAFAGFAADGATEDLISDVASTVQRAHTRLAKSLREIKLTAYDDGVEAAAFNEE